MHIQTPLTYVYYLTKYLNELRIYVPFVVILNYAEVDPCCKGTMGDIEN